MCQDGATAMSDQKRPYRKRQRAEHEAETRRRITESAVELHGTLGPARTSISAIAEHAGVRRSTVYRHFPNEDALFDACSSHWAAANPLPDVTRWAAIADDRERLETALRELYAYFARVESMLENVLRDEQHVPSVARQFTAMRAYFETARDIVCPHAADAITRAATRHAMSFRTWQSLVREQGLTERDAVQVMCRLVVAANEDVLLAADLQRQSPE
jgi:AcrR family transcriptional regulator